MKPPRLALITVLLTTLATQASSQACGSFCTTDFWDVSSPQEIEVAIGQVDINSLSNWDETPLHWAAGRGTLENVLFLIEAGADVNAGNRDGSTPLHYATGDNGSQKMEALINAGAEVDALNKSRWTPLHWAAEGGTGKSIVTLMLAGANGAAKTEDGDTAFDLIRAKDTPKETEAYRLLEEASH